MIGRLTGSCPWTPSACTRTMVFRLGENGVGLCGPALVQECQGSLRFFCVWRRPPCSLRLGSKLNWSHLISEDCAIICLFLSSNQMNKNRLFMYIFQYFKSELRRSLANCSVHTRLQSWVAFKVSQKCLAAIGRSDSFRPATLTADALTEHRLNHIPFAKRSQMQG